MNIGNQSMTRLNSSVDRYAERKRNVVDHSIGPGPFKRIQCVLISTAGIPGKVGANRARKALIKLDGVVSVHVIFIDSVAKVYFDPDKTRVETIMAVMQTAGFDRR